MIDAAASFSAGTEVVTHGKSADSWPAPVVLFAFNRPDHTWRTVDALSSNVLAGLTDVTVYIDGPRNSRDAGLLAQTKAVLRLGWAFKSLTIIESDHNRGLARSILEGVSAVVEQAGRVIVLEDDLVTSPYFLTFMNEGLDTYANQPAVWHISGFNENIDLPHRAGDAYLQRAASSWGWATWSDRWRHCNKNATRLAATFTRADRFAFDLDGAHPKWQEVEANLGGYIDSWAIFWYATIFENNGLCLYPVVSYVENIGFDGSGVHCGVEPTRSGWILNQRPSLRFPIVLREDSEVVSRLRKLYRFRHVVRVQIPAFFKRLGRARVKYTHKAWAILTREIKPMALQLRNTSGQAGDKRRRSALQ